MAIIKQPNNTTNNNLNKLAKTKTTTKQPPDNENNIKIKFISSKHSANKSSVSQRLPLYPGQQIKQTNANQMNSSATHGGVISSNPPTGIGGGTTGGAGSQMSSSNVSISKQHLSARARTIIGKFVRAIDHSLVACNDAC